MFDGGLVCPPWPFIASYDFRGGVQVSQSAGFLDFKRLSAEICSCKEWDLLVSCLAFSTLAHTSCLMLGGA